MCPLNHYQLIRSWLQQLTNDEGFIDDGDDNNLKFQCRSKPVLCCVCIA